MAENNGNDEQYANDSGDFLYLDIWFYFSDISNEPKIYLMKKFPFQLYVRLFFVIFKSCPLLSHSIITHLYFIFHLWKMSFLNIYEGMSILVLLTCPCSKESKESKEDSCRILLCFSDKILTMRRMLEWAESLVEFSIKVLSL